MCTVCACGGRAKASIAPDGRGGADAGGSGAASAGGSVGAGATGAAASANAPDASVTCTTSAGGAPPNEYQPDAGTTCDFAHIVCGGLESFVDIQGDGAPLRLAYPRDSGCGTCTDGICELWSFANASCGTINVTLSACAGPDGTPPCLDTLAMTYVDRSGKTWRSAVLTGSSEQPCVTPGPFTTILDLDLTLTIYDGTTTRELPAHVRSCGDVRFTAIPCH